MNQFMGPHSAGKGWLGVSEKNGATVRSRTADILITSEVLYQLSYGGSPHQITNLESLVNLLTGLCLNHIVRRSSEFWFLSANACQKLRCSEGEWEAFVISARYGKLKFSLKSSLHAYIVCVLFRQCGTNNLSTGRSKYSAGTFPNRRVRCDKKFRR
jgi:hypothetical protein